VLSLPVRAGNRSDDRVAISRQRDHARLRFGEAFFLHALLRSNESETDDSMTATFAPLPLYDFPELAEAHGRLWRRIAAHARRVAPVGSLPLTQICGYPLVRGLANEYDVVAAPVYAVPYSTGALHCGLLVVAESAPYAALEDLRGTRFAFNAEDSNTGTNLPRRRFAALARRGRFFSATVRTGSHAASFAAIAGGEADAASIDNVTFALLADRRPAAVRGVRVLAATAPSPTPPFVTPRTTGARTRGFLFEALAAAIDDVCRAGARDVLRLAGIERATLDTYAPLSRYEREAAKLGYGALG
jgi:hypothetical protein